MTQAIGGIGLQLYTTNATATATHCVLGATEHGEIARLGSDNI